MTTKDLPSADLLRKLLQYDQESGRLTWLPRTDNMFRDGGKKASHCCAVWNSKYAGREAFTTVNDFGYRVGRIARAPFRAHRVIWAMQTGEWPVAEIDHRDGNPGNNRWENLRQATSSQNKLNQKARSTSLSGLKGAHFHKAYGKWESRIRVGSSRMHLGYFDSAEAAHQAYASASAAVHGEFGRP